MKKGRPTLYKPEYCEEVVGLCRLGYTLDELAVHFKVHVDSIKEWMKVHPMFSAAVKEGREDSDRDIINALYKRAKGFTGDDGKFYPPDPASAIFWLKNRQRKNWNNRAEELPPPQSKQPPRIEVYLGNVPPIARREEDVID